MASAAAGDSSAAPAGRGKTAGKAAGGRHASAPVAAEEIAPPAHRTRLRTRSSAKH